jgi:hypothetical protein
MSLHTQQSFQRSHRPLFAESGDVFGSGQIANSNSSERESSEGKIDMRSNGLNSRRIVGHRRNYSSMAEEKNANQDWLAAKISGYSVAEIVAITGMSETAVQNVRRGKGKLNFDNMTAVFKAHPELGTAYMEYIGVLVPGQSEMAAAYTRFANAAVRVQL